MRALKYLIPEDLKNSLNANPGFQWFVTVIMFVIGIVLIRMGLNGVKNKRLKGKHGRVFEGVTAQILGVVYIILGLVLPIVAIAAKF